MTKQQKPIQIEASLKYICESCQASHWLFLREAQTENFKVVCECGSIFIPQQIHSLNIQYTNTNNEKCINDTTEYSHKLDESTVNDCIKTLCSLGYDKAEATGLVAIAYKELNSNDSTKIIKYILRQQTIGV